MTLSRVKAKNGWTFDVRRRFEEKLHVGWTFFALRGQFAAISGRQNTWLNWPSEAGREQGYNPIAFSNTVPIKFIDQMDIALFGTVRP